MDAAEILHTLTDQGFGVAIKAGALSIVPASRLSPALRAEIRAHKPELVELLTQAANDWPDSLKELERLNGELRRKIDHAHLAANAEAIGNALESSLIEGAEALAKIRPATDPIPLATATRAEVEAWLDANGETNPETRREILIGYGFDPDFQYPDSGRRTCRQCANLEADGGCRAARRGQIPNASRHYTWPGGIDALHRCVGYRPGRDDHITNRSQS